jgi:hypothetical protein
VAPGRTARLGTRPRPLLRRAGAGYRARPGAMACKARGARPPPASALRAPRQAPLLT